MAQSAVPVQYPPSAPVSGRVLWINPARKPRVYRQLTASQDSRSPSPCVLGLCKPPPFQLSPCWKNSYFKMPFFIYFFLLSDLEHICKTILLWVERWWWWWTCPASGTALAPRLGRAAAALPAPRFLGQMRVCVLSSCPADSAAACRGYTVLWVRKRRIFSKGWSWWI